MFTRLATLISVAVLVTSCSRGTVRVQTRSLPIANPTNYSFPLPVEDLRARALEAFSTAHQAKDPIFGRSAGTMHFQRTLYPQCSTNDAFAQAIFRDPANTNDIYLHALHDPFVESPVYRGRNGGLPFLASFHLHLSAAGSNTIVSVAALETEIINGEKFGIGSCGPGYAWNYQKVKPTTVEEYSLLRYLGSYIGVTNMPDVIVPTR
jgi:hypothetical protein